MEASKLMWVLFCSCFCLTERFSKVSVVIAISINQTLKLCYCSECLFQALTALSSSVRLSVGLFAFVFVQRCCWQNYFWSLAPKCPRPQPPVSFTCRVPLLQARTSICASPSNFLFKLQPEEFRLRRREPRSWRS